MCEDLFFLTKTFEKYVVLNDKRKKSIIKNKAISKQSLKQ